MDKLAYETFDGKSLCGSKYEPPQPPNDFPTVEDGLKVYRGSCYCGAVTLSMKREPLTEVTDCNCSICYKVCLMLISILVYSSCSLLTVPSTAVFGAITQEHLWSSTAKRTWESIPSI